MTNNIINSSPSFQLPSITIITATYNAEGVLPTLIESLRAQTDKAFDWVVADGASTDNTLKLLAEIKDLNLVVDSHPDFGIYDAFNRAIKIASGEYYLALGADDKLYPEAIASFRHAANTSDADLVTAQIFSDGCTHKLKCSWPWLYGPFAYVSGHAVGTLIRKSLHEVYGMYSPRFPIAADQLFLKKACNSGVRIMKAGFVAGEYCTHGISSTDVLGALTEGFRIQLLTGEHRFWQLLIFLARLVKNYRRL